MRKFKSAMLYLGLTTITLALGAVTSALGGEIVVGQVSMTGTGFGNVNTILTMQALGTHNASTESGS
jgi:hypothetical protein